MAFMACRKPDEISTDQNIRLSFSNDTVLFDTVFTAVGSINKRIRVYNPHAQAIRISDIRLSGGQSSNFSLIINGEAVNQKSQLKLDGMDSISIFIKVLINPNNLSLPFIVQDSILFNTNGNLQSVQLLAYGQNAVFVNDQLISSNTNWNSELPYIIYKSVTIAPEVSLRIQEGTRILFHHQARMRIRGSLRVEGSAAKPVLFAGDRMENFYADEAGQWNGLHFYSSSRNSSLQYATIKNAVIGITADSLSTDGTAKVMLNNLQIKNMSIAALAGYGTRIIAFNNLFYNCGQYLIYGVGGGSYNLKQNTFAGYNPGFNRKNPALYLTNKLSTGLSRPLYTEIVNNIIWGSQIEEFMLEQQGNTSMNATIKNNLIKTTMLAYTGNNNLLNMDPIFAQPTKFDFSLSANSPAYLKGADLSADPYFNRYLNKDLNGNIRSSSATIGCFE